MLDSAHFTLCPNPQAALTLDGGMTKLKINERLNPDFEGAQVTHLTVHGNANGTSPDR